MVSTPNNNNSNNVRKRLFQTSFNNEKSIQNLQNKQELILRSLTNYKLSLEKTQKIINNKFILYTKKYSEYKMLLQKYKLGINRTDKSNTIEKFLELGRFYSNAYKNIEDEQSNSTRFLVLSTEDVKPSSNDKTSIVVATKNKPGAIAELVAPFAKNKVSMTKLESRPAKIGMWEYVFFIDIEGHQTKNSVKAALKIIESKASFMKILGSYPKN